MGLTGRNSINKSPIFVTGTTLNESNRERKSMGLKIEEIVGTKTDTNGSVKFSICNCYRYWYYFKKSLEKFP